MTDPLGTPERPPSEHPPARWPGRASRWLPAAMAGWAIVQAVVFARFGKALGFDTDSGFGFALFLVTTASTLLLGTFMVLAVRHARASQGEERGAWGLAAALAPFLLPVLLSFYAVPDYQDTDYDCHRWGFVPASVRSEEHTSEL